MVRVRRVDCTGTGWRRRRQGRGFVYLNARGARIRDRGSLERIRSLVIPPAWEHVWICPDPVGHIQATGLDDAGRRQYLYHEGWRTRRDAEKFDRMLDFARTLPGLRQKASRRLRGNELTRERVLSWAVLMLDRGLFRIGGEEYAEKNGSYGLTTLERRHLRLGPGHSLLFDYEGKSGQRQTQRVVAPAAYAVAAELKGSRRRDPALLAYRDGSGWAPLHAADVNAFIKELAGDDFSAKDFRTWHATVLAETALAQNDEPATAAGRKRAEREAVEVVADALGNTPAVCRSSYIDPRVFELFRDGRTIRPLAGRRSPEPVVLRLLERA